MQFGILFKYALIKGEKGGTRNTSVPWNELGSSLPINGIILDYYLKRKIIEHSIVKTYQVRIIHEPSKIDMLCIYLQTVVSL